jgi:16S rRNA processing protein RimM
MGSGDADSGLTLLEVGRIARPHGLRGEVVVDLVTDRVERLAPGSRLATRRDGFALEVEASRPHQGRFIVRFAGVHDREAADGLRSLVLLAEPIDDPTELWVHDAVGAAVVDVSGTPCGVVAAVVANPASDLLELDTGALVPAVFVVSHAPGRIVIDPPAGLLDV